VGGCRDIEGMVGRKTLEFNTVNLIRGHQGGEKNADSYIVLLPVHL